MCRLPTVVCDEFFFQSKAFLNSKQPNKTTETGESHSIEVYRNWFRHELLRLEGYHQAEQKVPHSSEESEMSFNSRGSNEMGRSKKVHKCDAKVERNGTATFLNEAKPADVRADSKVALEDAMKLVQATRDQYSHNDAKPQIVVSTQYVGRDVTVHVARPDSERTNIVGMPIVLHYQLPNPNDTIDVAEWFGFVDAMLCVVPFAVQLPLSTDITASVRANSTPSKVCLFLSFAVLNKTKTKKTNKQNKTKTKKTRLVLEARKTILLLLLRRRRRRRRRHRLVTTRVTRQQSRRRTRRSGSRTTDDPRRSGRRQ